MITLTEVLARLNTQTSDPEAHLKKYGIGPEEILIFAAISGEHVMSSQVQDAVQVGPLAALDMDRLVLMLSSTALTAGVMAGIEYGKQHSADGLYRLHDLLDELGNVVPAGHRGFAEAHSIITNLLSDMPDPPPTSPSTDATAPYQNETSQPQTTSLDNTGTTSGHSDLPTPSPISSPATSQSVPTDQT